MFFLKQRETKIELTFYNIPAMFSLADARAAYFDVLEKSPLWYSLVDLIRKDLKRGTGYEFHLWNNQFIDCMDEITQCDLCLRHTTPKLIVERKELVIMAKIYIALGATQKAPRAVNLLNEPFPRRFNYDYVQDYLLKDQISESIARVTRVYNSILTMQGLPAVPALNFSQMDDLKKLYAGAFAMQKIPLQEVASVESSDSMYIISGTQFIDKKLLIIKPSNGAFNKFILQIFAYQVAGSVSYTTCHVPQLTTEQVAQLPAEMRNEPVEYFARTFPQMLANAGMFH